MYALIFLSFGGKITDKTVTKRQQRSAYIKIRSEQSLPNETRKIQLRAGFDFSNIESDQTEKKREKPFHSRVFSRTKQGFSSHEHTIHEVTDKKNPEEQMKREKKT